MLLPSAASVVNSVDGGGGGGVRDAVPSGAAVVAFVTRDVALPE